MQLVIGYGNTLRSDDGIGPAVAALLPPQPDLEVITCHQLLPEHAAAIAQAQRVVFIDAAVGTTPGAVAIRWVEPEPDGQALTHHVTPSALLAASRDLYGYAPRAALVTVCGNAFAFGEQFSDPVRSAIPEALRVVAAAFRD